MMRNRAEILREKLLLIEPWRNYVDLHKDFFSQKRKTLYGNTLVSYNYTLYITSLLSRFTVSEVTDSLELLSFAINRH